MSRSFSILGYNVKGAVLSLIMAVRESHRFAQMETIWVVELQLWPYVKVLKLMTKGKLSHETLPSSSCPELWTGREACKVLLAEDGNHSVHICHCRLHIHCCQRTLLTLAVSDWPDRRSSSNAMSSLSKVGPGVASV